MTLEQIKVRIKAYYDTAESELAMTKNERGFLCLCSEISAYRTCMALLDQLEPRWHPYPKEQPKKDGNYIVTTKGEDVQPMTYENGNFYTEYPWVCTSQNDYIIAWAEMPMPYKEEE